MPCLARGYCGINTPLLRHAAPQNPQLRFQYCSASICTLTRRHISVPQVQLRSQDISWAEFLRQGGRSASSFRPHVADAQDAASILFSSGTTGE